MRADRRRNALIELGEAFRELTDAAEIAHASARIIGEALAVDRAGYGAFDAEAETIIIEHDWKPTAEARDLKPGYYVSLSVSDTGSGSSRA